MVFPAAMTGRPRNGGLIQPSSRTFSSCFGGGLGMPENVMVILLPGLTQSGPWRLVEEPTSAGAPSGGAETGVEPGGKVAPDGEAVPAGSAAAKVCGVVPQPVNGIVARASRPK